MKEVAKIWYNYEVIEIIGIVDDFIHEQHKKTHIFYEQRYLSYLKDKYINKIKNTTIIDIGANIGNHAIFFKKFMACDKIICFEPISELYECLALNMKNNDLEGDFIGYQFAVGLFPQAYLGKKDINNWGSYREDGKIDLRGITCVTLDSMTFRENIGMIKIDVEGMEYEVLQSAVNTIKRLKPKVIVLESWDIAETINTCGKLLFQFGYKLKPIFDLANKENCWNLEFTI